MFNYNPYYRYNPYSMYNINKTNSTFTNEYKNSTNSNTTIETISENENQNYNNLKNNPNLNKENEQENLSHKEKENGFRIGPLTVHNDQIDVLGFSFAIDDLIIIGLMLIIFLDSDSDFILLIILGLILFNVSFSNLNLF